ncbi:MAG TPA: hypothetical protein VGR21_12590, partial [Cryptosporangiaceae bacterium]|nr:hypothetical protein [Cryptosporangiaceae bacterium]
MHERKTVPEGARHPVAAPEIRSPPHRPDVVVRRIRPDDGAAARALRLEALADTPLAYMDTLADAAARPMVLWDAMAAERASGDAIAAFVADVADVADPADAAGALVAQSGAVADANDR